MVSVMERCDRLYDAIAEHYANFPVRMDKPCGKSHISDRKKCSPDKLKQLTSDLKAGDAGAKKRVAEGKKKAAQKQALKREVAAAISQKNIKKMSDDDLSDALLESAIAHEKSRNKADYKKWSMLNEERLQRSADRIKREVEKAKTARSSKPSGVSVVEMANRSNAKQTSSLSADQKKKIYEEYRKAKGNDIGIDEVTKAASMSPADYLAEKSGSRNEDFEKYAKKSGLHWKDTRTGKSFKLPSWQKRVLAEHSAASNAVSKITGEGQSKSNSNPGGITPGKGRQPSTASTTKNGKPFRVSIDSITPGSVLEFLVS